MIEHLVEGVWLGQGEQPNCLHLCFPYDQKGWSQGGSTLSSHKGQPWKGEHLLGYFLGNAEYLERLFSSWVSLTLYMVLAYLQILQLL